MLLAEFHADVKKSSDIPVEIWRGILPASAIVILTFFLNAEVSVGSQAAAAVEGNPLHVFRTHAFMHDFSLLSSHSGRQVRRYSALQPAHLLPSPHSSPTIPFVLSPPTSVCFSWGFLCLRVSSRVRHEYPHPTSRLQPGAHRLAQSANATSLFDRRHRHRHRHGRRRRRRMIAFSAKDFPAKGPRGQSGDCRLSPLL